MSRGNARLACSASPNQKAACCLSWSGSVDGPPEAEAKANPVALAIMYESSISVVAESVVSNAGLSPPVIFSSEYPAANFPSWVITKSLALRSSFHRCLGNISHTAESFWTTFKSSRNTVQAPKSVPVCFSPIDIIAVSISGLASLTRKYVQESADSAGTSNDSSGLAQLAVSSNSTCKLPLDVATVLLIQPSR